MHVNIFQRPNRISNTILRSCRFAFLVGLVRGTVQIGPEDNFQLGWNIFVFGWLVYNMFMIPFRLAFKNQSDLDLSLVLDYFGDVVFLVDMIFR